jgi:predicted ATP-dependent endonuclease of OLD family
MMKGKVVQEDGRLLFESIEDRRKRSHEILSSGTLELLPIFNTLAQVAKKTGDPIHSNMPAPPFGMVYIEEPESSVFPETQYQFAMLIGLLANSQLVWKSYAITTHSPYILSAFGYLVKAGMVGAQSEEHRAAVAQVIPEQYWIKEGDFAAYKIENGKLESIFDKKTGQIDGDYLDDVSGKISEEFGQLLEIQYGR